MLHALTLLLGLTFTSADGSTIAATLSYPQSPNGKVPVVVLVGSNGPVDRTQPVGVTPVFDLYAGALNDAGFAVLRYDNRGNGQSTTKTQAERVRRQNFIDDAAAAVRAAAEDPAIDASRIFVIGLSEGGETAIAAALEGAPVRGLVLIGPLSVPYAQAMAEQDANANPLVKQRDSLLLTMPYFQSYEGVDPRREIASVRQPLLLMRGFSDTQTPAADFDGLVAAAQTAHRDVTVKRFAGDDHFLLRLSDEELRSGPQYGQRHELDRAAVRAIVTWLLAR
jgi:pimeloyl-ACP methyl ester carboxylesterase